MFSYPYAKPSVTATVFAMYNGMLLVGTRAKWVETFPGKKCVPGGFLEAYHEVNGKILQEGETVEQTAIREFEEECGVEIDGDQLILFHEHSGPQTDPRCHVVNLCYIVNLRKDQVERLQPGDDLEDLDFMTFDKVQGQLAASCESAWAFNHLTLANMAVLVWRKGGDFFQGKGDWA